MNEYLERWPGKSAKGRSSEHPAVYHMLDVAAVSERLLIQTSYSASFKAALTMLIAFHDLGKIGEGFRNMIRTGAVQPLRHWELTEAWLSGATWLRDRLGANPHVWRTLIAAVAGHHGRPSTRDERYFPNDRVAAGVDAVCDIPLILDDILALWPEASLVGLSRSEARQLSWWLSGLTVASDWVGSHPEWFPSVTRSMDLRCYLEQARGRAATAVAAAGLQVAGLKGDASLFDFVLRPMQIAARDIPLPEGPTLAVIEDETGSGKTEAALILAQRMLAAGKGRGLYVALPTMATADAMFERAEEVMGRLFDGPSLTLAHGRAHLSGRFRDLVGRPTLSDDVTCSSWLADNRHRALLADVGVGTVDQALFSILPVRFSTLYLWGLSSKILIVDEAHEVAGDAYMVELLAALLRAHAAQGGSAILLTATLPLAQRTTLIRAFAEGAGKDWPEDDDRSYPSLSIAGGATCRDFDRKPGPKGVVRVRRLSAASDAMDLLVASAARGAACVWIRNSVDEAIAAAEALRDRGIPVSLLHARFVLSDRQRIEAQTLARFGKHGEGRAGHVLVATQVVESSLNLDFDVMVSDLAPMAALIQRAGRLWRYMTERPREHRAVPDPVLYVLSPTPDTVTDQRWLVPVLGRGAWVYPITDQWRTADLLFRVGEIPGPGDLRAMIEVVHSEARPVPAVLEAAEREWIGAGYGQGTLARHNVVDLSKGYRDGGAGAKDTVFPTRLGQPTRILVLARWENDALIPWAEAGGGDQMEAWMRSEVQASKRRLDRLPLPDQTAPAIKAAKAAWPVWRREIMTLCPVGEDGMICDGLRYDSASGLLF